MTITHIILIVAFYLLLYWIMRLHGEVTKVIRKYKTQDELTID
jgi:protein-S-isoprenylcysteine O-methyltransferase Ste14